MPTIEVLHADCESGARNEPRSQLRLRPALPRCWPLGPGWRRTGLDVAQRRSRNHDHLLAGAILGCIFKHNSDAMNPEARCPADRPCLEGSELRNRLSEALAWSVFFPPLQPEKVQRDTARFSSRREHGLSD